eukprot:CAMPEP_0204592006 /NCGR_PEP_ID=MMETSP0661-20131031/50687_1 /ASSEMBLY_ACC=CAM_ASM_000606 /TAXON_ID=109239 /ORGANISM="Alexandrium margalefi, Strain AMGDE01CS-322" /LENGTH=337 /DNA_ID=CAMNT_0051602181 /DNA_START=70 /DNA_END=1083 /DNA_ORIENTATION=+
MGSAAAVAAISAVTQEDLNLAMANLSPEERTKLCSALDTMFAKCRYGKKKVLVHGKHMAYIEIGEGDPIVLIHGNPTSSYMWRNVIPFCEKLGRVIAPDLIGMGDSDKLDNPGPESYQMHEQMQYLDGLLEALSIKENVTFVVHSWGGVLGGSWAERHRDAMKGFVAMETVFSPEAFITFSESMQAGFKMFKTQKGEDMVLQRNIMVEHALPEGVVRKLSEEEHNEYRRPFLEPGESRRPILSFVRSVPVKGEPAAVHKMQTDILAWFKTTEMPVLFIKGDPGSSVTPEEADVIRSFKKVTEEAVKGKHLLTEDAPDEIGTAIANWYCTLALTQAKP